MFGGVVLTFGRSKKLLRIVYLAFVYDVKFAF